MKKFHRLDWLWRGQKDAGQAGELLGEGADCFSRKRQVLSVAPWEQLHCNVQAVRNLQSTVPVRVFFPAPLTLPSSDSNRAVWIVLKKLTSLHFLLFLAFTDAHCICGSLRGHASAGRHPAGGMVGCREMPLSGDVHDPPASLGLRMPTLGCTLRKAYLNFQSPFLSCQ